MILLILLASVLIATVTIYQYKEQTDEYNLSRLERKEQSIHAAITYWLNSGNTFPLETKNLPYIFKDKIYEISNIEKSEINIYDLEGNLVKSSHSGFVKSDAPDLLSDSVLEAISNNFQHPYVNEKVINNSSYQTSYSYITDNKFKPFGILNLRYVQDNSEQNKDLKEFLYRLSLVYAIMFFLAILMAYFISSYITRSLKAITEKISQTRLSKLNEKITLSDSSTEIATLINAYNEMVDELEQSAIKLAKSEREQAWREMAKQVAHEIKNPLTPMRLTVQSFQRKFDPKDPNIQDKINEFSNMLIQQIDTLSTIASAFSNFASMPAQNREKIDVVEVVKQALDIFTEDYISFFPKQKSIIAKLDKTQVIRIVTNLVKNATQSLEEVENKELEVTLDEDNGNICIIIADNGKGISEVDGERVFEPKFTTKTSGMGLGLAMVKNIVDAYDGSVTFTSKTNIGTVFTVKLPKK
ncbi:MAG TPA: ATP-binding protein [Lutibacter sp.]